MVYTLLTFNSLDIFTSSCCSHFTCSRHKAAKLDFSWQQSVPQIQKGSSFLGQALAPTVLAVQVPKCSLTRNLLPLWWGTGMCLGGAPVGRMSWTPCKKGNEEQEWAQGQLKEAVYLKDCLHFWSLLIWNHWSDWHKIIVGRVWSDWRKNTNQTKPNQQNPTIKPNQPNEKDMDKKRYKPVSSTDLCPIFKNQFFKLFGMLRCPNKCKAQDTCGL